MNNICGTIEFTETSKSLAKNLPIFGNDWLILQMWLERATKLRQLLTQTYDVIDKQLMGGASESHVTENGHAIGIL